jgi:hypothetical protein
MTQPRPSMACTLPHLRQHDVRLINVLSDDSWTLTSADDDNLHL